MPEVSVIIPVYNTEKYLSACLDSVLNQTFKDFEIIVVDDGSTDGTPRILEEYAARDARIRLIRQANSGKPSVARNTGIRSAIGSYITFLDADDLYEQNKLKREYELLERHNDIDVVFSDLHTMSADGTKDEKTSFQQLGFLAQIGKTLIPSGENIYLCPPSFYCFMSTVFTAVTTQTVMIRRSRLLRESVWFPENMYTGEDMDLWFRLAKNSTLLYVDEPLACYRRTPASITTKIDKLAMGLIQAHSLNYERAKDVARRSELRLIAKRVARNYFDLAHYYRGTRHFSDAYQAYINSLKWQFSTKTVAELVINTGLLFFHMISSGVKLPR